MIRAIIFDVGNVLAFFDYTLTLHRLAPWTDLSPEEVRAAVITGGLHESYELGQISSSAFLERVRQLCGLRCDDTILASAWSEIFRANEAVCALVPRLKPTYRLLVGSNTNELHARQFRRQLADTLQHFEALVLSHEVGARKPRRDFFEHCQRRAGCAPEECVFIDDLPANVAGAQAVGLHGIVYQGDDHLHESLRRLGVAWSAY
jgi:putative hydrolase of the HAD superfamily